jgi:hypothetical protein
MNIKRLVAEKPIRKLGVGLLASGLTSLLVLAGMGPADAAVTSSGNGLTLRVVSTQLVSKVAFDVNLSVTCTPSPTNAAMFSIIGFTVSENVKGSIVSYEMGNANPPSYPPITCDGTAHRITYSLLAQTGTPWFKPGPAYISDGNASAFPSDGSCGTTVYGGNLVPLPCGSATFSGAVQISG